MAVAGLLAQYMSLKAQLSEAELQDTRYNNLMTANSKNLSKQEKAEENYEKSYDDAEEAFNAWHQGDAKNLSGKKTGKVIDKDNGFTARWASLKNNKAAFCERFARENNPTFDKALLDEYADLDMEYGTMVAMYDTLVEQLQAQADSTKSQTSTESQDTHMIS